MGFLDQNRRSVHITALRSVRCFSFTQCTLYSWQIIFVCVVVIITHSQICSAVSVICFAFHYYNFFFVRCEWSRYIFAFFANNEKIVLHVFITFYLFTRTRSVEIDVFFFVRVKNLYFSFNGVSSFDIFRQNIIFFIVLSYSPQKKHWFLKLRDEFVQWINHIWSYMVYKYKILKII